MFVAGALRRLEGRLHPSAGLSPLQPRQGDPPLPEGEVLQRAAGPGGGWPEGRNAAGAQLVSELEG